MSSSGVSYLKNKKKRLKMEKLSIGVIGGSGLCRLPGLKITKKVDLNTPYGKPSDKISLGEFVNTQIAFIPRHKHNHTIPPHKVPYKANLFALKELGINHVIATCVVGSLRKEIKPGTFVVPDQFINLTWGRDDTFEIDKKLIHLPMAEPYCNHIRNIIVKEIKSLKLSYKDKGTVMVIQGPRFSTISESKMFASWGGDIVNMTQYPEVYFAREIGLCYASIATVTDYDVGIPSAVSMKPNSMEKVLKVFNTNTLYTATLLESLLRKSGQITKCDCSQKQLAEYYKLANT